MASRSLWIPHIEAYVDSSRPSSEKIASVDALAVQVNDVEALRDLVRELELYLTTTDSSIRSRGMALLADVLDRLVFKPLDGATISSLIGFFSSRLADWKALHGALVGCLVLLRRKANVGAITAGEARNLARSYLDNVHAQSLAVHDRKLCFEVLQCLLDTYPDVVRALGDDIVYGVFDAVDGEKDPQCLKLTFHLVETIIHLFEDKCSSAAEFPADIFEILGCYFPVYFTHPGNDDLKATRKDLSMSLMLAFSSTPYLEPFVIPLLLEKLSSSLPLAKLDSLKYLNCCIPLYGVDRMNKHAKSIWNALKDVIFRFSSEIPLPSTANLSRDLEFEDIEILREALICLQTATKQFCSQNNLFLNLIIEDEEVEAIFLSVTDEKSCIENSKERRQKLNALACILSMLLKVSIDCYDVLFLRYFSRLMDILGAVNSDPYNGLIKESKGFSKDLNFGALYLTVEFLASCRDFLVSIEGFSLKAMNIRGNWYHLLESYSAPLTHLLGSALQTCDTFVTLNGINGEESIYYRVKGLQVLSTFPGDFSPLGDDLYENILVLFMSIITGKPAETHLWKLSLKALVETGFFLDQFHDSNKKTRYSTVVLEPAVSLLSLDDMLPLPLKLEVVSEIGVTGSHFMVTVIQGLEGVMFANLPQALVEGNVKSVDFCMALLECYSNKVLPWCQTAGKFDEVASHFVVTIWGQIGGLSSIRIDSHKDLFEATATIMKLAVGGCTVESQNLIVQKAYDVFSSTVSFFSFECLQFFLDFVSLSAKDELLLHIFAAVLIGLHPHTYIPNIRTVLKLLTFFTVKGYLPAAQALASVLNKFPEDIHKAPSYDFILDDAIKVVFEICLSNVRSNRNSNCPFATSECTLTSKDTCSREIHTLVGLAWVGKGLLMRGHAKVRDITMIFLNYILSNPDNMITSLEDHDAGNIGKDWYSFVARSSTDAFHILLTDSDGCLLKKFHATIKPLYKQRFFSSMFPIILSSIKGCEITTRLALHRTLGHLISGTPLAAILTEIQKVVPALLDSLSVLDSDACDGDMIYNLLLVLSGVLMDENGKQIILEHLHIVANRVIKLISYPYMMIVRETAIQCLLAMSDLPHSKIYPMRLQVIHALSKSLDDRKRAVRQEAVRCRQAWLSLLM